MPRKPTTRGPKKQPNIVSVWLTNETKADFDAICDQRGMTIKSVLGRLIAWFAELDRTEQAIVMGQVEATDRAKLADMLQKRK